MSRVPCSLTRSKSRQTTHGVTKSCEKTLDVCFFSEWIRFPKAAGEPGGKAAVCKTAIERVRFPPPPHCVTHHHRGDVIYFCLHRGQFALKHCKTASPHSIKRLECVRENSARRQREPTERPQTNYLAMKRKSMNTRIRSGIAFLGVCVLVGLVAFFAGAHAQVATQSPGATATPARTATPFPTFAPGITPRP